MKVPVIHRWLARRIGSTGGTRRATGGSRDGKQPCAACKVLARLGKTGFSPAQGDLISNDNK